MLHSSVPDVSSLQWDTAIECTRCFILSVGFWNRVNQMFHHFSGILKSSEPDVSPLQWDSELECTRLVITSFDTDLECTRCHHFSWYRTRMNKMLLKIVIAAGSRTLLVRLTTTSVSIPSQKATKFLFLCGSSRQPSEVCLRRSEVINHIPVMTC
jgi:hypothetical protein